MQLILDNISAIIVAGAVILALGTSRLYAQHTSLEQTSSYATKTKALIFGEWLEDDILSLGANYGDNTYRFETPQDNATTGNTELFQFYSDSLVRDQFNVATGDTLRLMTRYRLVPVDTVNRGGNITELFEMRRETTEQPVTNGVAATPNPNDWEGHGRSMSTLSRFRISMLARDGSVTLDPNEGEFIRVAFALVPEYPIEPEYLRELYFSSTLKVRPFWEPMSAY